MKRILVTGANKGIGFAIVQEILANREDTFVYLGARDTRRGEEAVQAIMQDHEEFADRVALVPIDVADDESVRSAARFVAGHRGATGLFGVVNNAGIGWPDSALHEVLEVNLHGMRRVCEAFIPMLVEDQGRVVNITSAAGPNYVSKCGTEQQRFLTCSLI